MSRRSNRPAHRTIWSWRRWIAAGEQDLWIARLQAADCGTWTLTERPGRIRMLLAVYAEGRHEAVSLQRLWGGQVRQIRESEWIDARPTPPTRIGTRLEIIHEPAPKRDRPLRPRLLIPHGMAFGSGDHATTHMLLRALSSWDRWQETRALDVGTGSGVLALTARLFGASRIVATDFDADAIRTARQNEALNFSTPIIQWKQADVKRLRAGERYDLVLANLFSGILCEAAPQLAGCVAPGGQLWLSGVLRTQADEVAAAYLRQGLHHKRTLRRGKWVMLQWSKGHATS